LEKLTPFSKLLIAAILGGSSVVGWHTHHDRFATLGGGLPVASVEKPSAPSAAPTAAAKPSAPVLGRPLRIAVSQWPGHMPILIAAGGLKTQRGSPAAALGLELEVVFIEDAPGKNRALQKGEVDFVWQTVDELPISLGGYKALGIDARAVLQIDWSRGGDACISSREVRKVEDLLGRRAATLLFSPDHTVFEFMITNSQLTPDQVRDVRRATRFSPDDFTFARDLFIKSKIEVACLWEPDVTLALAGRPGSHRLFSTADATELVADVLFGRKELVDTQPELVEKLARAWFAAVDLAEKDRAGAARLISTVASRFRDELGYEKTLAALGWVKWTSLADNARFFGLDGSAPAFDRVYNQADSIWINYPEAEIKDRFAPSMLRDDRIVRKIWESAGRPVALASTSPAPELARTGAPVFTKSLSIGFTSGSHHLTHEAIAVINQQVLAQMQMAGGMSVRIEGNTDNAGDPRDNQTLSEQRAQAIVEYLTSRGIPAGRMVARGNGAANPRGSNATPEGRAQNRRTDILFIRGAPAG
jgi:outer membrane protein OmpA-like peptidoglycan-associated protein/ABC-type nitrate/sulfonate/bicarbonate transport system substrate-binding protein